MTPRQRILATLARQRADAIPFDIGGTDCSGIHVLTYRKLRAALGLPAKPVIRCACLVQLIAELDEDVMRALGCEAETLPFAAQRYKVWRTPFGVDLEVPERFDVRDLPDGSSEARDAEGRVYARRAAGAYYFDPHGTPLAHLTEAREVERFAALFERWDYSSVYDEPLAATAARARARYAATDRAVVALWRLHYLQSGQILRGYEQFLVDLMADQDMAHAILARLHDAYLRRIDAFFAAYGDAFDVVFLTDDLGSQQSGLLSPALYRKMIKPYIAEVVARIKARGKRVVMHSCGAVADFIPDLIDIGVDALNPVQVSARGMNPADLARRYGRDLAFWGGGCDTQGAMTGTPEQVRADVHRRLREFGPDASLVFTQVHNIQYDVPPENIVAMRDEFRARTRGADAAAG